MTDGTSGALGTAAYMSPEQAMGESLDERTDLFSFGVVLYYLATGKQPFSGEQTGSVLFSILREVPAVPVTLNADVPQPLADTITKCLEKDRKLRYQHAWEISSDLRKLRQSRLAATSGVMAEVKIDVRNRAKRSSSKRDPASIFAVLLAVFLLAAAGLMSLTWLRSQKEIVLTNYTQLTHDGEMKTLVESDASNLFMNLGTFTSQGIAEMPMSGGDPVRMPMPPPRKVLLDVSHDGKELLVVEYPGPAVDLPGSLWRVPLQGGPAKQVGNLEVTDASWSMDGKKVVYSTMGDLYLAGSEGEDSHKLATFSGLIRSPQVSPDGMRVRFTWWNVVNNDRSLWEVSTDGKGLHQLFPQWKSPSFNSDGKWTADGKYYLFHSNGQIWALPERRGLLSGNANQPLQLTYSPLTLGSPLASPDGTKLFVVGRTERGVLERYSDRDKTFKPFLSGISAESVAFSKDGNWIAYVTFPEGTLWRSRMDGSDRLRLSEPPLTALNPRWSPDGKQIAFWGQTKGNINEIYVVDPKVGKPDQLVSDKALPRAEPNWSPDGKQILYEQKTHDGEHSLRIAGCKDAPFDDAGRIAGLYVAALVSGRQIHCRDAKWRIESESLRLRDTQVDAPDRHAGGISELVKGWALDLFRALSRKPGSHADSNCRQETGAGSGPSGLCGGGMVGHLVGAGCDRRATDVARRWDTGCLFAGLERSEYEPVRI